MTSNTSSSWLSQLVVSHPTTLSSKLQGENSTYGGAFGYKEILKKHQIITNSFQMQKSLVNLSWISTSKIPLVRLLSAFAMIPLRFADACKCTFQRMVSNISIINRIHLIKGTYLMKLTYRHLESSSLAFG